MHETIDGRDSDHLIGEDPVPCAEGLVGGDGEASGLVVPGDEYEENGAFGLVLLCVGDLVVAKTSVLFELISARYEGRSMLITANQPFGAWDTIFPDPTMPLAADDRIAHHATIFEMNAESYLRKAAVKAKGPGRSPKQASPADVTLIYAPG